MRVHVCVMGPPECSRTSRPSPPLPPRTGTCFQALGHEPTLGTPTEHRGPRGALRARGRGTCRGAHACAGSVWSSAVLHFPGKVFPVGSCLAKAASAQCRVIHLLVSCR